jgi:uncharacterized glyoxalase superfamily protein PhnB
MPTLAAPTRATLIPCLRYRNAPLAIDWLCKAFGFEKQAVYPNPDGSIAHAQLSFGNGMVMLGSAGNGSEYGQMVRQPDEIGGRVTQSSYVVVTDADALHESAIAAGAEITIPLADADYGGRGFSCKDIEGHLWSFGTYDPWAPG